MQTTATCRSGVRTLLPALLLAGVCACQSVPPGAGSSSPAADLLLTDAKVYTVDPTRPWAQAVAVREGHIIGVGSNADMARYQGPETQVVNLHGRMLMPAFGDAHVHPVFGGLSYSRCSLHGGHSVDDYLKTIAACVARTPGTGTIYGIGWEDGLFPPSGVPDKALLDRISTDRPLIFLNTGGHGLWVNSRALALAGITRDTPDPENGKIDRDQNGEPVGGLEELAMNLVDKLIPPPTQQDMDDAISYTVKTFNAMGITTWHDAAITVKPDGSSPMIEAYHQLQAQGGLSVHVTMALKWENSRGLDQLPTLFSAAEHARSLGLTANAVKFFVDGVVVQRTAAMIDPYQGTTDDRGLLQIPPKTLDDAVTAIDAHGLQAHFHAIGDGAVRAALDAIQAAREHNGVSDHRDLISHMNVVEPADIPRFGQLGAVAIFQPLWACREPYMDLTIERIGAERARHIYPTGAVEAAGGAVAYGSDWPVASANPFEGIQVALTRIAPGVDDRAPLLPGQEVSLPAAIRSYTLNVAYANHLEQQTGSITPGKFADLIVVDHNLFDMAPSAISQARVLVTLFEGKPVYGDLNQLGN